MDSKGGKQNSSESRRGFRGEKQGWGIHRRCQERVTGIEPVTSCLGSRRSTAELHPLALKRIHT